jgi:hypothetical protein
MPKVEISVGGGRAPVRAVTVDLDGDGQPAWYYLMGDARGTLAYTLGPLGAKTGRFQMSVSVVDERGCEAMLGAPLPVVQVQR